MRCLPLLLVLVGCPRSADDCPDGTTSHARGVERWCEDADGEWHGPYERRDASGSVVLRGRYRHGEKAGPWSRPTPDDPSEPDPPDRYVHHGPRDAALFDVPDGAVVTVSADGIRTVTRNGIRIAQGRFLADVPVGVHRAWRDDGTPLSEIPHDSDGRPDGEGMLAGERVRWDRGERVMARPSGGWSAETARPPERGR